MVSYAEICASNARITPAHLPRIAVFVGGAAGIGNAALTALVSQKNPLKVYIVGQNQSSRESWLESLQQSTLDAEIVRLEGQVSLLSEVKRLCTEINNREQRVDLLWLSAGFLPLTGRHETSEGLETSLALLYWTRILFITHLLPLLTAASYTKPPSPSTYTPRVISILGAGFESPDIPLDDLDLRNLANFSLSKVARQAATFNRVVMARLAKEEGREVVFIHAYPGEAKTEIYRHACALSLSRRV